MSERKLVYIPMIHHCLEKRDFLENLYGAERVSQYFLDTSDFWKIVDVFINKINVKIDRIFWEGWTGNEKELSAARKDLGKNTNEITDDVLLQILLEATGEIDKLSNIVLDLIKKGAVLEETESRKLLNDMSHIQKESESMSKTYKNNKNIDFKQGIKNVENGFVICQKRDRHIAKQINDNLLVGETGILFMGKSHNVLSYLSNDLEIITDGHISNMAEKISSNFLKHEKRVK
jgi:hypothetical protein